MPTVLYRVTLTQEERMMLQEITTRGKHGSQKVLNALILLGSDEGTFQEHKQTAARLCEVLPISMKKVDRVKRRFIEQGIEIALDKRKADRQHMVKADGDFEAHLLALSCNEPPQGHARWSLRLLADKMVELEYVDSISHETVRRVLKKRIKTLEESAMGYPART
jgi:tryptophan 2,3-dioxygenase